MIHFKILWCFLFHSKHVVFGRHENTTTGSIANWWFCQKCGLEAWGGQVGPKGSIWKTLPAAKERGAGDGSFV